MEVTVIRSNRKTMAIQVNSDLTVTVRAPMRASSKEIEPLSYAEIQELADKALEYIPGRVAYFSKQVGVNYGGITIRNQKTRWGSCSSKGNLNFNCLLMLTPPKVIDYVVVHELCHRKEMNHSKAFWDEVAKILPDYKKQVQWLKNEGGRIMRRQG